MVFGKTGAFLRGLSSKKALSLSKVAHTWGLLTPEQVTGASGVRDLAPTWKSSVLAHLLSQAAQVTYGVEIHLS